MAEQQNEPPILELLRNLQKPDNPWVKDPSLSKLRGWTGRVRFRLEKIYGKDAKELAEFSLVPAILPETIVRETFTYKLEQLGRIIKDLEALVTNSVTAARGKRIFIGHGRSHLWRELKDFIADKLRLPWEEFNREEVAGYTTFERLEIMLSQATFAFIIMTAEEEHGDGKLYARPNVMHELGLFQGRLGPRRTIVMMEEGCAEFSNIIGLSQIRFPRGDILARSENVRSVLVREGLI